MAQDQIRYHRRQYHRRQWLIGAAATAVLLPFASQAEAQGFGLGSILGSASDKALDKLALPGGYYNDPAIRIGLPFLGGGGGLLGSLLGAGQKLGVTDGIIRTINDAAGTAAGEAKPIFRSAINGISFSDVPGIVQQSDGGTQYLHRSAGEALHGKMSPLVDTALGDLGAYRQLDKLTRRYNFIRSAGVTRESMNKSVTDQGLNGIFSYMGSEEKSLRANPLGKAGDLLGGILKR